MVLTEEEIKVSKFKSSEEQLLKCQAQSRTLFSFPLEMDPGHQPTLSPQEVRTLVRVAQDYWSFTFPLLAAPSQAPGNLRWEQQGSELSLGWEPVQPLVNESEVMGYKVSSLRLCHALMSLDLTMSLSWNRAEQGLLANHGS